MPSLYLLSTYFTYPPTPFKSRQDPNSCTGISCLESEIGKLTYAFMSCASRSPTVLVVIQAGYV